MIALRCQKRYHGLMSPTPLPWRHLLGLSHRVGNDAWVNMICKEIQKGAQGQAQEGIEAFKREVGLGFQKPLTEEQWLGLLSAAYREDHLNHWRAIKQMFEPSSDRDPLVQGNFQLNWLSNTCFIQECQLMEHGGGMSDLITFMEQPSYLPDIKSTAVWRWSSTWLSGFIRAYVHVVKRLSKEMDVQACEIFEERIKTLFPQTLKMFDEYRIHDRRSILNLILTSSPTPFSSMGMEKALDEHQVISIGLLVQALEHLFEDIPVHQMDVHLFQEVRNHQENLGQSCQIQWFQDLFRLHPFWSQFGLERIEAIRLSRLVQKSYQPFGANQITETSERNKKRL